MPGSVENDHPQAFINAPIEKVAKELVAMLRTIKPDIVLTFDPIGGYMHPDHIAAHEATVLAFKLSSNAEYVLDGLKPFSPKRLYFHVIPRGFFKLSCDSCRYLALTQAGLERIRTSI
jgi:LmbE family N-acetylglucosaminyl deacetylase